MMKQLLLAAALIASPSIVQAMNANPLQTINSVQGEASRNIKYKLDDGDVWQVAGRRGDCEDIVLWKRQQLMSLGFDASDLEVVIVLKPKNKIRGGAREGHVILRVKSQNIVLDNFERFPQNYDEFMKKYELSRVCEAIDFSPVVARLQDRCRPKG